MRDLNSNSRQDLVCNLVDASRVDIVCIQETKKYVVTRRTILSSLSSEFSNFFERRFVGASGGILVAWRHNLIFSGEYMVESFSVSVKFSLVDRQHWWLTAIYGPQDNGEKVRFLQELREIQSACAGPWVVARDFNLIYKDEDKNNTNLNRAIMGRFWCLIDDLAIIDIPIHGRKFVWSNQHLSPTLVRLDRVLYSVEWEAIFSNVLLQSEASYDLDHLKVA